MKKEGLKKERLKKEGLKKERLKKEGLKARRQRTGCFQNEAPRFEKKRRIDGVFCPKDV